MDEEKKAGMPASEDQEGAGLADEQSKALASPTDNAQPTPGADGEQQEIIIPGRATKRQDFQRRHTGTGAQVVAFLLVLAAIAAFVFNRCGQSKDDKSAADTVAAAQVVVYTG